MFILERYFILYGVQGIVYVTYDTGPWVAIKMRGNKFHGWLGVGSARFDFNVITISITIPITDNDDLKSQS